MYAYYMCQCTHTYMYLACIHVPQNMVLCVCTVPHMHYDYTVYTVMHKYSKCKKKPDRFYTHVCTCTTHTFEGSNSQIDQNTAPYMYVYICICILYMYTQYIYYMYNHKFTDVNVHYTKILYIYYILLPFLLCASTTW